MDDEGRRAIAEFLNDVPIRVTPADGDEVFDILVDLRAGEDSARVRITSCHTNIVLIEKNGTPLYEGDPQTDESHPRDTTN